jgi:glycosyltransferase involved in cell wall biosynthesis
VKNISVVIISKNEAERISRAILSVRDHVDEVLVVDGGSTDETVSISRSLGARVIENPWSGYAVQRNFGALAAANDWIFALDSDEETDQTIKIFLMNFRSSNANDDEVYAFERIGDFLGVMLPGHDRGKHIRVYNRLYHRFNDVNVHETVDALNHQVRLIDGIIIHHGFRSIKDHVIRFNIYTDLEASERFSRHESFSFFLFAVKPPVRLLYQILFRGLWRRGLIGIFVSLLWVYYDILVQMKLYELKWRADSGSSENSP